MYDVTMEKHTHVVIIVSHDDVVERVFFEDHQLDIFDQDSLWEVFWKNSLHKKIQMADLVTVVCLLSGDTIVWKNRYGHGGRVFNPAYERVEI